MEETGAPQQVIAQSDKPLSTSIISRPPTEDGAIRSNKSDATQQYPTGFKLVAVIGSVALVCFLALLDQSILSTATPLITTQFHSLSDVGWYAGAFQLASAALQPLTGKFYTYLRIKWTFMFFLFVFELGSLICGVATSSPMLIGGRAIAGLGASGLFNGGLTIITVVAPLEKRPLYTGFAMGVAQLGIISGPLIGGALTQYTTWRWCFYINLPLGALVALGTIPQDIPDIGVKEKFGWKLIRQTIPKLDLPGFALLAPAAIMLLLALQFGSDNKYAWSSSTIIGLFVGAAITALVYVAWEYRVGEGAMIPRNIISKRVVWSACAYQACLMSGLIGASFYLPIYFQAVKGVTPTMSGVDLLPSILATMLIAVSSGALVSKLGFYLPWAIGGSAVATLGYGLLSTLRPDTSTGKWIGYQIIVGGGRGAGMQMAMVAIQTLLPIHQIPIGLTLLVFFQNLFASIAIVVATTIFTQTLSSNLTKYAPGVNIEAALAAGGGAEAVRALVPKGDEALLQGVLKAYSKSVGDVFYLLIAFAGIGFFFGWGMGWGDVRKKPSPTKPEVKHVELGKEDAASEEDAKGREEEVEEVETDGGRVGDNKDFEAGNIV